MTREAAAVKVAPVAARTGIEDGVAHQPNYGLVDDRRRGQRVVGTLVPHQAAGRLA